MPINRFFSNLPFQQNEDVFIAEQEHHHLAHVARVKVGDTVELVNGKGELADAVVKKIDKKKTVLTPFQVTKSPSPKFRSILVQAIPRINRLDLIVEKATELGISELRLFPGMKSEKKALTEHQLDRLNTILIGAMKQCGRLYLPQISLFPPLEKWDSFLPNSFFGDISSAAPPLFKKWLELKPNKTAAFFIGPESGFSEKEIEILKSQKACGVSLNENILRTDTASICALAIVHNLLLFP